MRARCGRVAEQARWVRIDRERLGVYAFELPLAEIRASSSPLLPEQEKSQEARIAFVLVLNAVNFGSGYFPLLRKRPGSSGYRTIEACVIELFDRRGPPAATELARTTASDCARIFEQTLEQAEVARLMELFARAWRDLGELIAGRFSGSFTALVDAASGSPTELIRTLLEMPLYRDVARYGELDVPFLKRAQLCVAELASALPDRLGLFGDLSSLTMFADNLVAHVLRMDGLLHYAQDLLERIELGELLESGSAEEVEIRACEVQAVEELCGALGGQVSPRELDFWLWRRGASPHYKAHPRHRTRCSFY